MFLKTGHYFHEFNTSKAEVRSDAFDKNGQAYCIFYLDDCAFNENYISYQVFNRLLGSCRLMTEKQICICAGNKSRVTLLGTVKSFIAANRQCSPNVSSYNYWKGFWCQPLRKSSTSAGCLRISELIIHSFLFSTSGITAFHWTLCQGGSPPQAYKHIASRKQQQHADRYPSAGRTQNLCIWARNNDK